MFWYNKATYINGGFYIEIDQKETRGVNKTKCFSVKINYYIFY